MRLVNRRSGPSFSALALSTVSALALTAFAAPSFAQSQAAQGEQLEEVVITGSRIVREGYEAPTPLAVVDAAAMQAGSNSNVAQFLNTMPVFSGSAQPGTTQNSISAGTAGVNTLNLRSLGAVRTLVLMDGQRSVGSLLDGSVDVNVFPQQLVQRVDVVTGGASAVYGSDAVAGVVNFILDKEFTGVKGEVSGGVTSYGDDKNYKVALTAGFPFAGGRGHVLASGEQVDNNGIIHGDGGREWNATGVQIIVNPLYGTNAAAGQSTSVPQRLILDQIGFSNATRGGLIISGPLKGTAFGPGGTPYTYNYGSLISNPYMQGGDWKSSEIKRDIGSSLDPSESRQNIFTRVSYDVTDAITIFGQVSWASNHVFGYCCPQFQPGNGPVIKADNAFIPTDIRARMTALGLTSFQIGSMNEDLPTFFSDNTRSVNRNVIGGNGKIDAFGSTWSWDAYFQNGFSRSSVNTGGVASRSKFALATDAVRNTNGQIVCRSTLTNPTNGCVPWNPLGTGVNTDAGLNYLVGVSYLYSHLTENVWSGSLTGEPVSLWAGPVSLAVSLEHRTEKVRGMSDAGSKAIDWFAGNYLPINGQYNVTEGALETVVPLAKDESWAQNWDLNAAARFTGYSTSGFVITYKIGSTYTPIPDVKFRVTRSRDIRAPNLQELFAAGTSSQGEITDPFCQAGSQQVAGAICTPTVRGFATGNVNLKPEKADTNGIGIVFQPSFIDGFSASVDYWDVNIKDAIQSISSQQAVDLCFQGVGNTCGNITRVGGIITQVQTSGINLAVQNVKGIDFEASYRFAMDDLVSGWAGNLGIHGNATTYLRNYRNDGLSPPTNRVGENGANNPPNWRMSATISYDLDPIKASLTGRAVSSGLYDATYITCTTGCPVSTIAHGTVNNDHMPGAFYLDAAFSYNFLLGEETKGEAFLNVRNLGNKDPYASPRTYYLQQANAAVYDVLGRVFRAGIRFKM